MPFPKAKKVSPVYQSIETGELLRRLTDSEGKHNPDAVRYETGEFKADGTTPIIAYFVPLPSNAQGTNPIPKSPGTPAKQDTK